DGDLTRPQRLDLEVRAVVALPDRSLALGPVHEPLDELAHVEGLPLARRHERAEVRRKRRRRLDAWWAPLPVARQVAQIPADDRDRLVLIGAEEVPHAGLSTVDTGPTHRL